MDSKHLNERNFCTNDPKLVSLLSNDMKSKNNDNNFLLTSQSIDQR